MTAATAAPGFLSKFPRANAPAACCLTHSVRKAVVATKTQVMPNPAELMLAARLDKEISDSLTKKCRNKDRSGVYIVSDKPAKQ